MVAFHKIPKLDWVKFEYPRRFNEFVYNKRNIIFAASLAILVFFALGGHSRPVQMTLAVFAFSVACWVLEVFPISITGLMIPIALSLTGVFSPEEAFSSFGNPVIFLLIGGLVLGQSIRKHELDKRIAVEILVLSGGKTSRIFIFSMGVTAFISMWMSNTVAVAMVLPIILTILSSISKEDDNLKKKMLFGIIAGSTLGGVAMLTGSTPNMIAAAALGKEQPFGFLQWAYYGIPVSLVSLVAAKLLLDRLFRSKDSVLNIEEIRKQKASLGPLSGKQKSVFLVFFATILLWFLGSEIEILMGLPSSISSASIVSILSVLVMFGLDLLDMTDVKSVNWDIMFIVGGGLLLGNAMSSSGAAAVLGKGLLGAFPTFMLSFAFMLLSAILTNFMSNSATTAMLVPVAIETARMSGQNPVVFVIGIAIASALAFVTPVGTPSTALVYNTGLINRKTMLLTGLALASVMLLVIYIATTAIFSISAVQ